MNSIKVVVDKLVDIAERAFDEADDMTKNQLETLIEYLTDPDAPWLNDEAYLE